MDEFVASDFKQIKDMTREELISEIARIQYQQLEQMDDDALRHVLVDFRASAYRQRLYKESGLEGH